MQNTFGNIFKVTTFGESHGRALGCVIDGCPAGLDLCIEDIEKELARRRPGKEHGSRDEKDMPEILSGIYEGKTLGTPIGIVVYNTNQESKDYNDLKDVYRPGHADYSWDAKFGIRDHRGGGRSSGRETLSRVAAGAVAKKILSLHKMEITTMFDAPNIEKLREEKDSAGGIITCRVTGVPAGLGEPVFDKLDARLAGAIVSIGACKGIEFGAGFASAQSKGSENNDRPKEFPNGFEFETNNAGGILGGISTGQEIIFRAAFKPTPSIGKKQRAFAKDGSVKEMEIKGRHDYCIVPRAAIVVEAMTALVLADFLLLSRLTRI
ncbi:MAG: chorismate synthase [Treponema sp.]|nr:chorismate synthase [Treponema sp.]MCL2236645.1 chorismate synthase [Treponema sp.]